jgi:trigger factor
VKTDVEKLDPTRVRLSVEVSFDELQPSLDAAYREIGQQIRVPGFRPGKAPRQLIDARVGRANVLEQAINDALPQMYANAIEETELEVVGSPDVDITKLEDGTSLTFTAEVDIKPEFTLPDRKNVEVTVDAVEITDADVDAELEALRERFGTLHEVSRPAGDGDIVTIDLLAERDGAELEGGRATGQTYRVGSGTMLEGLDEAIRGLSAGESATFQAQLVGDPEGVQSDITVTVTAVKERELQPLDDDFAQLASEFDTVEELREDTRRRLQRAALQQQIVVARDRVLDAYLESIDMTLPERLVAHEIEHRDAAREEELRMYGLTKAQYLASRDLDEEGLAAETDKHARTAIKTRFVLEAIAADAQLSVDENELTSYLLNQAARSGMSPDEYVRQITESGSVSAVVGDVARGKALALLVRDATVRDSNGEIVDIATLDDQLTAGDTAAEGA